MRVIVGNEKNARGWLNFFLGGGLPCMLWLLLSLLLLLPVLLLLLLVLLQQEHSFTFSI